MGRPSNVFPSVIPLSATTPSFHPQQQSNPYRSTIAGPDHTRITQPFVTETLQQQMFDVLNLPKPSLTTFDGDPIDFHFFMNSFDACIHAACFSDACKLNRLLDLCKGKAHSVIRSCSLMQPTQGYNKARSLLEQRFGNEYVIAEAWISKITQGPPIKKFSGEALQDFADEVRSCAETLRAMVLCVHLCWLQSCCSRKSAHYIRAGMMSLSPTPRQHSSNGFNHWKIFRNYRSLDTC